MNPLDSKRVALVGCTLVWGASLACTSAPVESPPKAAREPSAPTTEEPAAAPRFDAPIECSPCEQWNEPREPFKVFGNTYFVGVAGLSAVLVASSDGLVLLDGGLPQSAPRIDANIRKLGFSTEDVRLILNSHEHYDHAGGIAALQRLSGARVVASSEGTWALMHGEPTEDDPQARSGREAQHRFPPVDEVDVVRDGETLTLGDVTITAHRTPGHTPGSTTWTWRSCEGDTCLDIVYADSLNAISDEGFRFTGDGTRASSIPAFERSIATIDRLPCDVLLSVHPSFSGLDEKLAARSAGATPDPFIDANACHAYASAAKLALAQRVADEG